MGDHGQEQNNAGGGGEMEVPEDDPELPRYMKILDEMDGGEYVRA